MIGISLLTKKKRKCENINYITSPEVFCRNDGIELSGEICGDGGRPRPLCKICLFFFLVLIYSLPINSLIALL